jgi:hypothetical protein
MPAPRRAILADISEQKLDPKVEYTHTNKQGKFVHAVETTSQIVEEKQVVEEKNKEKQKVLAKDIDKQSFTQTKIESEEEVSLPSTTLETNLEIQQTENLDLVEKVEENKFSKKKLKKKA